MGFLSGSVTYECFRVVSPQVHQFGPEHVELLEQYAINQKQSLAADQTKVGFLAGEHLFDRDFDLEKNIINDTLHFAVRIDSNQIPAAIRKAWLQMELAVFRAKHRAAVPRKLNARRRRTRWKPAAKRRLAAASIAGCSSSLFSGTLVRDCSISADRVPVPAKRAVCCWKKRSSCSWSD